MDLGSSPLARGGPGRLDRCAELGGLIPARAGRTLICSMLEGPRWAHPRSRGADVSCLGVIRAWRGSSPLARGGPHRSVSANTAMGLIPARAGRTSTEEISSSAAEAHPRSRGADCPLHRLRLPDVGSSPLARGGQCLTAPHHVSPRLIPARAGRTGRSPHTRRRTRAHPRSRGADVAVHDFGGLREGSSPLARGGPDLQRSSSIRIGLIPARAGRTFSPPSRHPAPTAHPRSRGADPLRGREDGPGRGLIPARAGRTSPSTCPRRTPRAHPRSRGADTRSAPYLPAR